MNNKVNRYRRYRRPQRNTKLMTLAVIAGVLVVIAAIVLILTLKPKKPAQTSSNGSSQTMSSQTAAQKVSSTLSSSSAPAGSSSSAAAGSSSQQAASSKPAVTEYTAYVPGKPVPESPPVDANYFKDAVFVGNSRTEGLMLYTGLSAYTTAFADKGLTVKTVFTKELVKKGDKKITVSEALKTTDYKKCYIMLGINELGWPHDDVFISNYEKIIDEVKSSHPDAKIYVQSILPVSASKSAKNQNGISNERINTYNKLLLDMTVKKNVYYLDSAASVKGADGTLPEAATSDGVHLDKQFCTQWLDYLKTHTVK